MNMNEAAKLIAEIGVFLSIVFALIVGALVISQMAKSAPSSSQPQLQQLSDSYNFAARIIIDWSSPDPTLWIIRILIGMFAVVVGGVGGAYFYFKRNE